MVRTCGGGGGQRSLLCLRLTRLGHQRAPGSPLTPHLCLSQDAVCAAGGGC
jgi:hypothetical protein